LGPTVHSTAGGNNFAYGGARTSGTGGIQGLFIRDFDEQVDQFLMMRNVDPNALFLVFAGSNDLVGGQTNVSIPVNNLAKDLGRLATAGARNFLVPNLPLLGHLPRFNDNPSSLAEVNARSSQFNAALDAALDNLEMNNPSLNLFRLDVQAMFSQALADPSAFGLANVTDAAAPGLEPGASLYNTSQIALNQGEYMFWDELHPTATVHAVLAERALALVALPGDFNQDDAVDAADYVAWRNGLGIHYTAADYETWRANFGAGEPIAFGATVPEPAEVMLLNAFAVLLVYRLRDNAKRCSGTNKAT
jgi:phospholipase/lecithinase/hemolysin